MSIKETIITELETLLEGDKFFIVDVLVSSSKVNKKVSILIDSDAGISIDECAEISRKLGNILEEKNTIDSAYTLEMSSPGVDYPLKSLRQYQKNIGRKIRVIKTDGVEKIGNLVEVSAETVVVEAEKKKNKDIPTRWTIAYSEIAKAQIQVRF